MKTYICILLFMLTFFNIALCQSSEKLIFDDDIYIYEYAIKKPNNIDVGFVIVNNNLIIWNVHFSVYFSKGKVKKIFKRDNPNTITLQYQKREDGNILLGKAMLCFNSENFINTKKRIPDNFYKMICSSFLEMTNKERLEILDQFSITNTSATYSNQSFYQIERKIKDFSDFPQQILEHLFEMGKDSLGVLSAYESDYFNELFQSQDKFDLKEKKIGFINLGKKITKEEYFDQERDRFVKGYTPISSTLYIFDEVQKQETAGYDAAIVYWSKIVVPVERIIKILTYEDISN